MQNLRLGTHHVADEAEIVNNEEPQFFCGAIILCQSSPKIDELQLRSSVKFSTCDFIVSDQFHPNPLRHKRHRQAVCVGPVLTTGQYYSFDVSSRSMEC